jgi:sugar phosphate isomerase/epimerase
MTFSLNTSVMDRRQFVNTSLWTAGAFCAGMTLPACSNSSDSDSASADASADANMSGSSLPAIGLQLYTIRSVLETDFPGTMKQVAEIGYDEIEFAGYYDRSPKEIGAMLDDLGLSAPAAHVPLQQIRKAPDDLIQTAQAIGHDYLVCPYLREADRGSLDAYRQRAQEFSDFGKRCSDAGLQFAYHNHDFEFQEMDGTLPFEVLLEETDPEHVQMELDLYWVVAAGHDPLTYIRENPDRYPLCHVKDRTSDGNMVSVGAGTMDFASIFRAGNFEHYFVEHDNPENPMQSIESSHQTLSQLTF